METPTNNRVHLVPKTLDHTRNYINLFSSNKTCLSPCFVFVFAGFFFKIAQCIKCFGDFFNGIPNCFLYRKGKYYSAHPFCDVNLVDHGYTVRHGGYGHNNYAHNNHGYNNHGHNRGYGHNDGYGHNRGYGHDSYGHNNYDSYGYGGRNRGHGGYGNNYNSGCVILKFNPSSLAAGWPNILNAIYRPTIKRLFRSLIYIFIVQHCSKI